MNRREALVATSGLIAANIAAPHNAMAARGKDDGSKLLPGKTPHTKFAVNAEMWFGKLPFLDRVRRSAELGFPAIEFWPWQGKDIDALDALRKEVKIEIAQFTAWGFRPGLNDPRNHEKFVAAIEKSCQIANKLECRKMCVVGGDDQPGMTQSEMHKNIIAGLKLAAPIAEKYRVMLILEPMNIRHDHKGHCLYGSPDAVRICREVGSQFVKINWDLYHMQISEGDLCRRLREGFDQVGYLQLADNPGRNEPGTGEVHYARVLKEAYDLGYRDYVGLECVPKETGEIAAKRVFDCDWR